MGEIYTIGHSNTTLSEFINKLDAHKIGLLIDIRSHPGSRHVLWANKSSLIDELRDRYLHLPDLGGPTDGDYSDPINFPKHRIGKVRDEFKKIKKEHRPKTWWNQGLYDFDLWMGSDPKFKIGLQKLKDLAQNNRVAICCSEVLWWKCHRSMVADAVVATGGSVNHIMTIKSAPSHPTGDSLQDRLARYDENTRKIWS